MKSLWNMNHWNQELVMCDVGTGSEIEFDWHIASPPKDQDFKDSRVTAAVSVVQKQKCFCNSWSNINILQNLFRSVSGVNWWECTVLSFLTRFHSPWIQLEKINVTPTDQNETWQPSATMKHLMVCFTVLFRWSWEIRKQLTHATENFM